MFICFGNAPFAKPEKNYAKSPKTFGGGHDLDNLVTLCSCHHRLLHEGQLILEKKTGCDLCFRNSLGCEVGAPHVRKLSYWPKLLDVEKLLSLPTPKDRQVAQAIQADLLFEEMENPSYEEDPNASEEGLEDRQRRRIREAIDDFYGAQSEERKKLVPGYRRYEQMARGPDLI